MSSFYKYFSELSHIELDYKSLLQNVPYIKINNQFNEKGKLFLLTTIS